MKSKLFLAAAPAMLALATLSACSGSAPDVLPRPLSEEVTMLFADIPQGSGYFGSESTLPFLAPDFSKISDAEYEPAFTEAMAIHKAEIEAIKNRPADTNIDLTISAMEGSGSTLGRVANVFLSLTDSNTTYTLDEINTTVSPKLSDHFDAITIDPVLF